ncbi:hypothetical protein ACQCVE_00285 [Metabacillus sp. 113a]|uniref:hypothetical protein n=1 Tax=Metabacillus sp. 113a TaxID=3404706 RepID=UPI003CE9B2BC
MKTKKSAEQLISEIIVPSTLSERQTTLAITYTKAQMLEGFNIANFCRDNSISSKTWYQWLEVPDFKRYITEIRKVIIPDDERNAYHAMKKHVMKFAYKESPTPKEIELFYDVFGYVADADKKERMVELGIAEGSTGSSFRTLEEKKAALMARLTAKS